MDHLLHMLQSANPSDGQPDPTELLHLEGRNATCFLLQLTFSAVHCCINVSHTFINVGTHVF